MTRTKNNPKRRILAFLVAFLFLLTYVNPMAAFANEATSDSGTSVETSIESSDDPAPDEGDEAESEDPAAEETDEEISEDSGNDEEPVDEEPVDEEPVDEEPVDEEPVDEEPVDEEPVIEEPVIEEPVIEEPVIEEPASMGPVQPEVIVQEEASEPLSEEDILSILNGTYEQPQQSQMMNRRPINLFKKPTASGEYDGEKVNFIIKNNNRHPIYVTLINSDSREDETLFIGGRSSKEIGMEAEMGDMFKLAWWTLFGVICIDVPVNYELPETEYYKVRVVKEWYKNGTEEKLDEAYYSNWEVNAEWTDENEEIQSETINNSNPVMEISIPKGNPVDIWEGTTMGYYGLGLGYYTEEVLADNEHVYWDEEFGGYVVVVKNYVYVGSVKVTKTFEREGGVPHKGVTFELTPYELDIPEEAGIDENTIPKTAMRVAMNENSGTDEYGEFMFSQLLPGTYILKEINSEYFDTEYMYEGYITVESCETTEVNVINRMIERPETPANLVGNKISGYKYNEEEQGLAGWTIQLYQGEEMIDETVTDENGYFEFTELEAGTYTVKEVMQDGWEAISDIEQTVIIGDGNYAEGYQNLMSDSDLNLLMPEENVVFVAEGRIGDNMGAAAKEMKLNDNNGSVIDETNMAWDNFGVPQEFSLDFTASDNTVVFTIGSNSLTYIIPEGETFTDIFIRTRATKSDSGVMINNLMLNGNAISSTSVAVGTGDGHGLLWLKGYDLSSDFSLTGQSIMYWNEENAPNNSNLAYQIKFGRAFTDNEEEQVNFMNDEITDPDPDPDPDPDDDDDDDNDDNNNNNNDDNDEDGFNETIVDEETPLAVPEIVVEQPVFETIDEIEVPLAAPAVPVVEIADEATPLAVPMLPQTGGIAPELMYGLGALITAIGFRIRKK